MDDGDRHGHAHSLRGGRRAHPPALLALLVPMLVATMVAVVALWPDTGRVRNAVDLGFGADLVDGTVEEVRVGDCEATAPGIDIQCSVALVRLTSGPDEGDTFDLEIQDSVTSVVLDEGDKIVLNRITEAGVPEDLRYSFADFQRKVPLTVLVLVFLGAVVALGRIQGLRALLGLTVSLGVLVKFVIPSILDGNDAVLVALAGASLVMLAALYLAHGVNERTTTAVVGTFLSLALTGVLALLFVAFSDITGLANEDARILTIAAAQVDVRGLLLGGIIIGSLGVLDDVTVTQVSAVWELHFAAPDHGPRELYRAALRIGRDHIASTVNTLVLAYAGASLPLLVLFVQAERGLVDVLTGETLATEIVRTLVGSIGLVASVPITTAIAATVVTRRHWAEGEGHH